MNTALAVIDMLAVAGRKLEGRLAGDLSGCRAQAGIDGRCRFAALF